MQFPAYKFSCSLLKSQKVRSMIQLLSDHTSFEKEFIKILFLKFIKITKILVILLLIDRFIENRPFGDLKETKQIEMASQFQVKTFSKEIAHFALAFYQVIQLFK